LNNINAKDDATTSVSYNLFWGNLQDFNLVNIEGIGKIVTKNKMGYDADSYYNLVQDPLFIGNIPPSLNPGSPCYGSGDKKYSADLGFSSKDICPEIHTEVTPIEIQDLSNVFVSPNPATDFLEISYSVANHTLKGVVNSSVEIFNVFGEKIPPRLTSSATPQGRNLLIDVSGLSPGVYFIQLGDQIAKFIKI